MKSFRPLVWPPNTANYQDSQRWGDVLGARGGKKPPESVRNLRYVGGNEKVTLQWDAPEIQDNVGGYRIYVDTETNLVREITDSATTTVDIVVNDPDSHNFFVSAMSSLKKESSLELIVGKATGFTSSSLFNPQGSMVPDQDIVVDFELTPTTAEFTVSPQGKLLADGSVITVSGSHEFTGLSGTTAYFLYSRVRGSNGTWEPVGTPQTSADTLIAAQCEQDGYIGVRLITFTTPASGTSPGTGGGGDLCPEWNEIVETDLGVGKAKDFARVGGKIKAFSFKQQKDVFRKIIAISFADCAAWRIVQGKKCSPCETVFVDGKWTMAFRVQGAPLDETPSKKICITVEPEGEEANYWLVSDVGGEPLLIHNRPADPS